MSLRRSPGRPVDATSVFINCPFDPEYWPLLEVMVFTVIASGFTPRSALEESDAGTNRLAKIQALIGQSAYGIHDISRVKLKSVRDLPRFNMPFELGLDIGCKTHGGPAQRAKKLLVLDAKPYRYQKCLSDIAGQDIRAHANSVDRLLIIVRDWLRTASRRRDIPGPLQMQREFRAFSKALPSMCEAAGLQRDRLAYVDYVDLVRSALVEANLASGR